ncbi:hypothetical protein AVEN_255198-1 [Araneus ventricosus]|uniref:Tc1-like transposase DDE domain-containing protein n=1 Tax=Araneus ventricosus TaxID=182803 RepID=A0A4Y2BB96_ARAVE|nr:hypothetical protein AVEN_255198-1 [Araneus ventricosus]
MVWGCLAANGLGNLNFCNGPIKAPDYIRILEVNLRPSLQRLFGRKLYFFQQDNARPHTAKITKTWLRTKRVPVLKWPAASPDLSPIENIWRILKRNMAQRCPAIYNSYKIICGRNGKKFYRYIEPFSVVHA